MAVAVFSVSVYQCLSQWHMINLKCYLEKQLLFFSEAPIVNNIIMLCERYAGTCSLYTHSLYHMGKITLSGSLQPRSPEMASVKTKLIIKD